jgi:hypothetical protein
VLLPPGSLPKTSSGKRKGAEMFVKGELGGGGPASKLALKQRAVGV